MTAEIYGKKVPDIFLHPHHLAQETVGKLALAYLRAFHQFEIKFHPDIPNMGPYLFITSHFSILDVAALMAADPYYPRTNLVVKKEMMEAPIFGKVLSAVGAIPVARHRQDVVALRRIRRTFQEGNGMCIAGQGTRSTTGKLGPMDESLVRLTVYAASKGIPVVPIVEIGTFEALPKGAKIPKGVKISVVTGAPLNLTFWVGREKVRPSLDELTETAAVLQRGLIELLPERYHPAPDERVIWRSDEYVSHSV